MINFYDRDGWLGCFAALLLLTQSTLAAGLPSFYEEERKPEIRKEINAQLPYVEVGVGAVVSTFLVSWITKPIPVDIAAIKFQNSTALSIPSHCFNVFYVFTSALAP